MKIIMCCTLQIFASFSFAAEPKFLVFSKNEEKVAFCKTKPPRLFELKIVSDEKIETAEVFPKSEPYEEGFAEFMDLNIQEMVESGAKPPKTCWVFNTATLDFPVLVKDIISKATYRYFKSISGPVAPHSKKEYLDKEIAYTLNFPAFDKLNTDGTVAGMRPKDVILSNKNWKCVMASIPYLDDKSSIQILLAADFNADELPDLIIEAAPKGIHYNVVLSNAKANSCQIHSALQHP